jgi:hypothetical protein
MDFRAGDVAMGENGSELRLKEGGPVVFRVDGAARLDEAPSEDLRNRSFSEKPYWHLERARLTGTRNVEVELLENGSPVARSVLAADGKSRPLEFRQVVRKSGWYAIRILPSSHTNPIFVEVGGKPIRERRSIQWCLDSVQQCWSQKQRIFRGEERERAVAAYDHARSEYQRRLAEADAE